MRSKSRDSYNYLINNLNNKNYAVAEILAEELLSLDPKDISALQVLIYININTFNFSKAISLVNFCISINSLTSEIAYFGAVAYLRTGGVAEAKRMLLIASNLNPTYDLVDELNKIIHLHELADQPVNLDNLTFKFNSASIEYEAGRLNAVYKTPEFIFNEVRRIKPLKYNSVLDLGCGTGLSGILFRDFTEYLSGVDLSIEMMALALDKKIYNELSEEDILQFLSKSVTNRWDVIIAASVFIYFGDLCKLFEQIYRVLNINGVVSFDLNDDPNSNYYSVFSLNGLQFQHGKNYVLSCANKAGLQVESIINSDFQYLKIGESHPGLIYSFIKRN
jgi:SAM-dependent methyltransferase